jgi:Na+-transporting NADH:ubiquinone oxidoreductase subunit NqrC
VALLVAGLVSLLFLNTVLAQGAFQLDDLQHQAARLDDREQALQQTVARLQAPQRLAQAARALGMQSSVNPVFLSSKTGKVAGIPHAAATPAPVVAQTTVASPSPTGTATPSSKASASPTPAPSASTSSTGHATPKASPSAKHNGGNG